MLTDVEVFAIRAAGLPHDLRETLYPELVPHCSVCDGTGDVHDATGEWRGVCTIRRVRRGVVRWWLSTHRSSVALEHAQMIIGLRSNFFNLMLHSQPVPQRLPARNFLVREKLLK